MNWAWPASSTIMSEMDTQYRNDDHDFLTFAEAHRLKDQRNISEITNIYPIQLHHKLQLCDTMKTTLIRSRVMKTVFTVGLWNRLS